MVVSGRCDVGTPRFVTSLETPSDAAGPSTDLPDDRGDGCGPDGMACLTISDPDEAELRAIADRYDIHELAFEDALHAHQRPKLERYGETAFLVLKSVAYDDTAETVDFGEVQLLVGPDFLVVVRHGAAPPLDLDTPRASELREVACPAVLVHRVIDQIVDAYRPVMDQLEIDVRETEAAVFAPDEIHPTQRIYNLKRQLLTFLRNTEPLRGAMDQLVARGLPGDGDDITEYFRDVADHVERVVGEARSASELVTEILDANLTQVSLRQNEEMRKMSAWGAIFLVPTLLAGLWGMNFQHMPELDWRLGYPMALSTMVLASAALWWRFKRIDWL